MLLLLVGLPLALIWQVYVTRQLTRLLNIHQIEEYQNGRFWRWVLGAPSRLIDLQHARVGLGLIVLWLLAWGVLPQVWIFALLGVFSAAFPIVLAVGVPDVQAKKPLVYTARAKRLLSTALVLSTLLSVGLAVGLWFALQPPMGWQLARVTFAWGTLLALGLSIVNARGLTALVLMLANLVMFPVEAQVRGYYLRQAKAKLARIHPRMIGITGSYGKTSTKQILRTILATRYKTLATPGSFNTPMGVCRVINNDLLPEHEIFIVEMGAYTRGEIAELCRLARPALSILTAVGPQHLERFGSIENVMRGKNEIMEALPDGAPAIYNGDNPYCQQLMREMRAEGRIKVYSYSLDEANADAQVVAGAIQVTRQGLTFSVTYRGGQGEERATMRSQLLGKHNVSNILAAVTAALLCGMKLDEIAKAVEQVEPVEHRLQLIQGAGGVTVIDDAYNANPEGVRTALEVLAQFNDGKRVLVTPGMVELGPIEVEENYRFGQLAAASCDVAILVGRKRTEPIARGLREAGFPEQQLFVVGSLKQATEKMQSIVAPGAVVLFANDLPDTYNEE
ncbi:MAG TPA: UDP-N-acetylmuramoyl-tripeptide--D-alanyl-D-alanine ligase [Ktedonobacterales bacterium]|nr:UDP-N-acetylmuramoyl-tripeptide--D-alanyl-D-alanine ligase [Ktedonobacterales bacterium]